MSDIRIHLANAFTHAGTGGNPAGVVLDADALAFDRRQHIAAQVGLSETAFARRRPDGDFELAFHTPTRAIPHCGHATLAAFAVLASQGSLAEGDYRHHTVDGVRVIRRKGDTVFMAQGELVDEALPPGLASPLATALGSTVINGARIASTGNRFLLVPLPSATALAALRPDAGRIEAISEELDLIGIYAYTADVQDAALAASTRMFAPRFGIAEEAATGMAAAPLGAVLLNDQANRLVLEQGRYMDPPSISRLYVHRDEAGIAWVGGQASVSGIRTVTV